MGESVFAVEIPALATASAAAVLAMCSLAWHLWTRHHSRTRVKVSDGHGMVLGADGGELVVTVRAENDGPLPVSVMGWGFWFKGGRVVVPAEPLPASPDVPFVLRPGEEVTFFVSMRDFEQSVREMGSSSARPFVTVVAATLVRAGRAHPIDAGTVTRRGGSAADLARSSARGSRSSIDS